MALSRVGLSLHRRDQVVSCTSVLNMSSYSSFLFVLHGKMKPSSGGQQDADQEKTPRADR